MQPTSLGRYIIEREIGRGAMGRVYLAHDPGIDRPIAIKTIVIPQEQGDEARERFLREARSVGKLLHPGIVTIFDVGESGKLLYLAMEHIQGRTFDELCRPGELLPVDQVCSLIAKVSDALGYAHAAGLVHRDVKPANLMYLPESGIKVMDFGLAKPIQANLTTDGALLGTPSYMAPEQIRGGAVDGRSDLFSLAVVLFEMLTGEKPFSGDSISSIIYRIVHEPPRDPTRVQGRTNPELDAFLQKALAKNPDDRFQTGKEFSEALRRTVERIQETQNRGHELEARQTTVEKVADPIGIHEDPSFPADESLPPVARRPQQSSVWPYFVLPLLLLAIGAGGAYAFRERLGIDWFDRVMAPPPEIFWEASVATDPPGLPVLLDGEPLEGNRVQFKPEGPFGLLTATDACRTAQHTLEPTDAGGEIVLFLDPRRLQWKYEPTIPGATVEVNGEPVGAVPVELDLDLCTANEVVLSAPGFQPATIVLSASMTPLEARTTLSAATVQAIPKGSLVLPRGSVEIVYFVDGERIGAGPKQLELEVGDHVVRAVNSVLWIDSSQTLQIVSDEEVTARPAIPPIGSLTVQAFPPNCKVYLRKPGTSRWKYIADTPSETRLAAGSYEVRVELNTTGETREQRVDIQGGANPPIRFAFARNP